MYLFWMPDWVNTGATDRNIIWFVYFLSASNLLLICAGFLYSSRVIELTKRKQVDIYQALRPSTFFCIILLAFICVVATYMYVKSISGIPFITALSTGGEEVQVLRSEASNAFEGKLHYFLLFKYNIS